MGAAVKEHDIHQVLRAVGINGVTRINSTWVDATCPFAPWKHKHGTDRKPSFGVSFKEGEKSFCHCFSCHWNGSLAKLVADLEGYRGITFPALVHNLVDEEAFQTRIASWEETFASQDEQLMVYPNEIFTDCYECAWDVPEARDYLTTGRPFAISEEATRSLDLRFDPDQNRIVFPVRGREGELYGFTGRAIHPSIEPKVRDYFKLPKRHLILGCHRWTQGKPVVLVEGLFAYAHLVSLGVEQFANVGAALGSVLTEEKANVLRSFFERVYVLFDPDDAGISGTWGPEKNGERDLKKGAVGRLIGHVPVCAPDLPEGCTDVDTLFLDEVRDMLDTPDFIPQRQKHRKQVSTSA